jgi:hypothetical protein
MNETDALINAISALFMLLVICAQGYMFGYLFTRKLLEYYDIYQIQKIPNSLMVEFGYCTSFSSCKRVTELSIENARKWERG